MKFSEKFDNLGNYEDEMPVTLNRYNFSRLVEENGEAWAQGYINAMEHFTIIVSAMLKDVKGTSCREQTPHKVRSQLKNFFNDNVHVLDDLIPLLEALPKDQNSPEVN